MPRRLLSLVAAVALGACLSGCDLALVGLGMPGLAPGIGWPVTGVVLDGRTHLPVGGATVASGLGWTGTGPDGRFSLYGNFGSSELSVARMGYTAITDGDVQPNVPGDLVYTLDPKYPDEGDLGTHLLELSGKVTGQPANTQAQVFLGDDPADVNTGQYAVHFRAGTPGKIMTAPLAWGTTTGTYAPPSATAVGTPFNFEAFYYRVLSFGLGDTTPQAQKSLDLAMDPAQAVPMQLVTVSYKGLASGFTVQTDIALDFGVVGSVPVARALASSQQIKVPQIKDMKYDVVGTATDPTLTQISSVQLTTNDPGKAVFELLPVPKVLSPANKAKGVGLRPTFSWQPIESPGIAYVVTVKSNDDNTVKWVGTTTASQITYPPFSSDDTNAGALEVGKSYSWSLSVAEAIGDVTAGSKAGPVPITPYRVRQRSARATGFSFTS